MSPRTSSTAPAAEQVPLYDHDAESAVVGCCLSWRGATDEALGSGLTPEHFSRPSWGHAFAACERLAARGEQVDSVTVGAELVVGGMPGPTTADLLSSVVNAPAVSRVGSYAAVVLDRARRRQLALALAEATAVARDPGSFDDVAAAVDRIVTAAIAGTEDGAGVELIGMAATRVLAALRAGTSPRLTTGLPDLDRQLSGGLAPGSLVVVGARPSMGKTAFALGIARHVAEQGTPVLFASAEQSDEELAERALVDEAGVPSDRVRPGPISPPDWERLDLAAAILNGLPIHIIDRGITLASIARAARALARCGGLGLVVVDYAQLVATEREERRELEVSKLARGLKLLARELAVPVVALSQLSRNVESRADKRPMLSDLRESGALEQDADVVIGLYRDEVYYPGTLDAGVAELLVLKHRNGPTGTVRTYFAARRMAFKSLDTAHGEPL